MIIGKIYQFSLSDEQFIQLCVKKDIDILIDLAGFTNNNRINAFRARCAPIQILWLGYCNSLGIKNMDYIVADKNLIKENEKICILKRLFICLKFGMF